MRIEVVHLKKHFGSTKAVDDITFSFAAGQVFGFIGPNGAGKTTTMRIMATLDEPTSGDVYLDGISVLEEPDKARRLIGYVPDSLPAHRDMTVHDYLDFFARAYGLRGWLRTSVVEQVEQFTNLIGIRSKALRALSKGMKQRVSLARALVHDPPLLIMDEPAAGLDPRARVELRELLKILADQKKAILISSHILTELVEICDGAVIIERGKLLRCGTLDELYNHGAETPKRVIAMRTVNQQDALHKALLEMPKVVAAIVDGRYVEAEVAGSEEDCCDLLAELLRRDFRILEFKQLKADLENIFMNLTEGKVQ
jgi:ABC-2 type transport system ATP-binding protein